MSLRGKVLIALIVLLAACSGVERDDYALYTLGCESDGIVTECDIRLPSPEISGFSVRVDMGTDAILDRCRFPDRVSGGVCIHEGDGKYKIAAADFHDYWDGTPQRARLVTVRILGTPDRFVVTPLIFDGDDGEDLMPIEGMVVTLGGAN